MSQNGEEKITIREPNDAAKTPINWDTATENELVDRSSVFSFETRVLTRRLGVSSNWAKIIVAHIYADHILNQTLTENLQKPSAFYAKSRRKYLLDKLEICEAMGWVDPRDATILRKINTLRNQFAHTLSFSVTKDEIVKLRNAMPMEYREFAEEKHQTTKRRGRASLEDYLWVVIVLMDVKRQRVLQEQYLARLRQRELHKAVLNARAVLDRSRGEDA